ncbi:MAG: hypothetical protein HY587_03995, partial [Candidatus Omnitrophica bacterium]|nr:hypothetical protein [Candidatus Omnitrophota bacterium]
MNIFRRVNPYSFQSCLTWALVVCLVAASTPFSGAQITDRSILWPANLGNISLPPEFGRISGHFNGYTGKAVIFIQDAHAHYEAQKNIVSALKYISENHRLDLIGVEGFDGPADFSLARSFPHAKAREKVLDRAIKGGATSGVEYFAMTSAEPVRVTGIDDEELYVRNIRQYAELVGNHSDFDKELKRISQAVANLKAAVYSENARELDRVLSQYDRNAADLSGLLRALRKFVSESKIRADDFLTVTRVFELLDSQGGKSEERIAESFAVNVDDLWSEIELLVSRLKLEFAETAAERELISIDEFVRLLGRGRRLQLNRDEFEHFAALTRTVGSQKLNRLLSKLAEEANVRIAGLAEGSDGQISMISAAVREFYETARERDRSFVEKLKMEMRRENSSVAALVAGGFHTTGILNQLRRQKISYLVVTPVVTEFPKEDLYSKLMLEFGSAISGPLAGPGRAAARLPTMYTSLPVFTEGKSGFGVVDEERTLAFLARQRRYREGLDRAMLREAKASGMGNLLARWIKQFQNETGGNAVLLRGKNSLFAASTVNARRVIRFLSNSSQPADIYRGVVETGDLIPLASAGFGAESEQRAARTVTLSDILTRESEAVVYDGLKAQKKPRIAKLLYGKFRSAFEQDLSTWFDQHKAQMLNLWSKFVQLWSNRAGWAEAKFLLGHEAWIGEQFMFAESEFWEPDGTDNLTASTKGIYDRWQRRAKDLYDFVQKLSDEQIDQLDRILKPEESSVDSGQDNFKKTIGVLEEDLTRLTNIEERFWKIERKIWSPEQPFVTEAERKFYEKWSPPEQFEEKLTKERQSLQEKIAKLKKLQREINHSTNSTILNSAGFGIAKVGVVGITSDAGGGTTWSYETAYFSTTQKAQQRKLLFRWKAPRLFQATFHSPFGGIASQPNTNVKGTINDNTMRAVWEEPENQDDANPAPAVIAATVSNELPILSLRYGSN